MCKEHTTIMGKLSKNLKMFISKRLFSKEYLLKYFALFYILIVLTSLISSSIIFYLSNKSIENEIHNRNYILLNNLILKQLPPHNPEIKIYFQVKEYHLFRIFHQIIHLTCNLSHLKLKDPIRLLRHQLQYEDIFHKSL
jgi:hypothetical protein